MIRSSTSETLDNPVYDYKITLEAGEMVSWHKLLKAFVGLLSAQGYSFDKETMDIFEDLSSEVNEATKGE